MNRCTLRAVVGLAFFSLSAQADTALSSVAAGGNFYSVLGPAGLSLTRSAPLSVTAQVAVTAPAALGRTADFRLGASYQPYTLRNGSGAWLPVVQVWFGLFYRAQPVIWKIAPTAAVDLGVQGSAFQTTSVYTASTNVGFMPLLQLSPGLDIPIIDIQHSNLGLLLEAPVQLMVGRGGFFVAWNGLISLRWRL